MIDRARELLRRLPTARWVPVLRSGVVAVAGLAGAYGLGRWLDRSVPLRGWFFFDLANIWFWNLYLSAACVSTGRLVVRRLLGVRDRTRLETLALAFPTGLVVFVLAMYVAGAL